MGVGGQVFASLRAFEGEGDREWRPMCGGRGSVGSREKRRRKRDKRQAVQVEPPRDRGKETGT